MKAVRQRAIGALEQASIDHAPVDLCEVADSLGVTICYEDLDDDVSGFLIVEDGEAVAVINNNHHSNRQRFTIAHELGHFCLHIDDKDTESLFIDKKYPVHHRNADSSLGTFQKEREANFFASVLLMPDFLVEDEINKQDIDLIDDSDAYSLAKKFGVSEQALGFRLARLGYEVGE